MRKQMDRLDQASRLLDEVMRLPLGHPDRLRYLTLAEQSLTIDVLLRAAVAALPKPPPVRFGRDTTRPIVSVAAEVSRHIPARQSCDNPQLKGVHRPSGA